MSKNIAAIINTKTTGPGLLLLINDITQSMEQELALSNIRDMVLEQIQIKPREVDYYTKLKLRTRILRTLKNLHHDKRIILKLDSETNIYTIKKNGKRPN